MRCLLKIGQLSLPSIILLLSFALVISGVLLGTRSVYATTNAWLPVFEDFGTDNYRPDPHLLVGNPTSDGSRGIDAPNSKVKIYSTNPSIEVRINSFAQCHGDRYDYLDPGTTRAEIFATDSNENKTGTPLQGMNNWKACSGKRGTMNVTHPGPRSSRLGHTQYYVFIFQARLLGSAYGWNAMRLNVPGQLIGYPDDAGEKFAIKGEFEAGDSSVARYAPYRFYFGVPCEITTNVTRSLRWFDADQGEVNQVRELYFNVYDETEGREIVSDYTNVGGQNASRSLAVTFKPGHKYRWVWWRVSSHNGIQMQMPFDSIYHNTVCPSTEPPPPPPPAPAPISCGNLTYSPTDIEAGQPFTISTRFDIGGSSGDPNVTYTTSLTLTEAGLNNTTIGSGTAPRNSSVVNTSPSVTISTPGQYEGVFTVNASDTNPSTLNCPFGVAYGGDDRPQIPIVSLPYFKVYGGDVHAGSGFKQADGSCNVNQASGFYGYNRPDNSGPFRGAGAQLAAFVMGYDLGAASGQIINTSTPKSLTFANQNSSYSSYGSNTFGGGMHASGNGVCARDYYSEMPSGASSLGPSTNASRPKGDYRRNGNLTINGGNFGLGANNGATTFYVDGNATITGDITYASGNYQSLDNIPTFRLIVRGNIYVEPQVSRLDGIYVAQPEAGVSNSGRFYSCWPGGSLSLSTINGICRNSGRLTIFGSVAADRIKLTRSNGTRRQATTAERFNNLNSEGVPAEVIIMPPEVWMSGEFAGKGEYDSVTALPPVL